jgi:Ca2+-binding RTX toxin-like protein
MIKVKAIKDSAKKQQGREYYDQPEQKKSIILLAFLLFLTGCAAYLKSFLPVRSEVTESKSDQARSLRDSDDRQEAPAPDVAGVASEAEMDEEIVTGSVDRKAKSSDNVIALRLAPQAVEQFLANDSPAMDFSAQRRHPFTRTDVGSGSDPGRPANENQTTPARNGDTSHPGGGGGGGGGSSGSGSDQGPKQPPNPDPPRNRAPRTSGPVQLQDLVGCHAYLISVLALLQGTTDADGDPLALRDVSVSSGTLTLAEGGGWLYTPDKGMLGDVTLTYYITDGAEIVQQTAHFRVVEAPPIVGTDGDDNLLGTQCADVIDGRAGNDNIVARDGNDVIFGGDGDDHIVAGAGNDIIHAGAGNDIVFAGTGNDIIFGGSGDDRLFGEQGDDTINGEDGDDLISGGEGADVIFAGMGHDVIQGDDGKDTIDGGEGNDRISGGADRDIILAGSGDDTVYGDHGDDVISDGEGKDVVYGGEGNDYVLAAIDGVSDIYSGDSGEDTLDYSSATVSIRIDVGRGRAESFEIGRDLIAGFERIISGQGDDRLIAGSSSISMTGGDGNDIFQFDRPDDDHQPDLVRKITDFTVGDRIIAASYEIRYREGDDVSEAVGDLFDSIYLSDDRDRPIRFRFEKLDNDDRTFIEVHDRPDSEEFYSIELSGHHKLEVVVGIS